MANNNRSLRIALVGYGKMGQNIAAVSRERHHTIGAIIDPFIDSADVSNAGNSAKRFRSLAEAELQKENIDVIIDFSTAEALVQNIDMYCALDIPVVIGTTGKANTGESASQKLVPAKDIALKRLDAAGVPHVYGSNFSIGVYLFSELAGFAAEKLNMLPQYDIALCEHHHNKKSIVHQGLP